ncbi:g-patch domain-containing [Pyrenophora seminiperda CCB06]|uniref:PinX1-related protein 1 n=1 Tax=Pyrenophora seminiperda CCB06 TaxID=1302712 RepID=A0A3M7MHP0_9PLEO|nr:g-patch domain-containing [Pyrenophora seminiperda CCB06]
MASRSKISNDPQNTTWANNTSRFGHRILSSQGWQPGDSLGAKDASHAAHYTAASQSHIRVLLKDDNLGLGAKRGSERAENFGLAGLESILGRLNGNEAEVKKEEERREEIEKRAFVYRKYGMMNFISGGFLVGDKITKGSDMKKVVEIKPEVKLEPESDGGVADKKSRKRKLDEGAEDEPKIKRKKKSSDLRDESSIVKKDKKLKKDKRDRRGKCKRSPSSESEASSGDAAAPVSAPEPLTDKARRKAEKKAGKEEKRAKKALKKAAKRAAKSKDNSDNSDDSSEAEENAPTTISTVPRSATPAPPVSTGLAYHPRGMHAVRAKWIRQKKAATMDAQAMKEIFMIKTPS